MDISMKHVYYLLDCLKRDRNHIDFAALEAEWRVAGMFPEDEP